MKKCSFFFLLILRLLHPLSAQEIVKYATVADLQANPGSKNRLAIVTGTSSSTYTGAYIWNDTLTTAQSVPTLIQTTGIVKGRWQSIGMGFLPASTTAAMVPKLAYANANIPAGNTIANTTAETFFASQYTAPANSLSSTTAIRIRLLGVYSTTTIAPTITGKVYIGSTLVSNTGAITTVAGISNGGWWGDGDYLVMASGTTGTIDSEAFLSMQSAATTSLTINIPSTVLQAIDTTVDNIIRVSVTWGTASVSNSISLRQMKVFVYKQS